VLALLAHDLAEASKEDMKSHLLAQYDHKASMFARDLQLPLEWITSALPHTLVEDELKTALRIVQVFGLHAARLDIREDSSRLNAALGEILRALNIEAGFENLLPDRRIELITRLLDETAPNLSSHPGVTSSTAETWSLFQLMGRTCDIYGGELLGHHYFDDSRAADVLTVLAGEMAM
jgi:phosphoenolpyruvate carboxylase